MKIRQIIPGDGGSRSVSRTTEAGRAGAVRLEAVGATVDITLTAGGQLWVNTRDSLGNGSAVTLVATLNPETGVWFQRAEAE